MSKIPAYIITLIDDAASMKAAKRCIESIYDTKSYIEPFIYPAVDHTKAEDELYKRNLEWEYPIAIPEQRFNMVLTPYKTTNINKRIACALSHLNLWEMISEKIEPFKNAIILEQDAVFERSFELKDYLYFDAVADWEFVCSLNSPINATRKSTQFDKALKQSQKEDNKDLQDVKIEFKKEFGVELAEEDEELADYIHYPCPYIDDPSIPQGLPGNSAYLITPMAAKKLVDKIHNETGLWPNDAVMCNQFFPDMLYCAYPYYTKVQGNKSTTSL